MATLDEIRLQQLLAPFSTGNQTGILNSTNALPMINNNPFINLTDQLMKFDPNIQNKSIVDQIIAENQMKASQFDPRNFQSIFPTSGIRQQVPQIAQDTIASNLLYEDMPSGIDTSYGVANEADVEEETKKENGIAKLFRTILGFAIPGSSLFMGDRSALQGIKSLNQRLRNTDFARSKTLADYFDAKRYGGRDERDAAAARTMAQARGIQKKIDTGEYRRTAADDVIDRGRSDRPGGANYSAPSKPQRSFSSDYSEAQRARKF
jgi:hypothetical protein